MATPTTTTPPSAVPAPCEYSHPPLVFDQNTDVLGNDRHLGGYRGTCGQALMRQRTSGRALMRQHGHVKDGTPHAHRALSASVDSSDREKHIVVTPDVFLSSGILTSRHDSSATPLDATGWVPGVERPLHKNFTGFIESRLVLVFLRSRDPPDLVTAVTTYSHIRGSSRESQSSTSSTWWSVLWPCC